jgi:hypothetical protein
MISNPERTRSEPYKAKRVHYHANVTRLLDGGQWHHEDVERLRATVSACDGPPYDPRVDDLRQC